MRDLEYVRTYVRTYVTYVRTYVHMYKSYVRTYVRTYVRQCLETRMIWHTDGLVGGGSHGEPFNLSHSLVEEQEKQIGHPFEQNSRLRPRSGRARRHMGQGRHHP